MSDQQFKAIVSGLMESVSPGCDSYDTLAIPSVVAAPAP
jgi:hypothetical protein